MIKEQDIAWAKEQLQKKSMELGRLPKKDDFDEINRSRIKAFLGPWPRALEVAGLKEAKNVQEKNKKRRKSGKTKKQKTTQQVNALKKLEDNMRHKEKSDV